MHLNVFADHDIDAAAEAIDDVSILFLFLCHQRLSLTIHFSLMFGNML